MQKIMLNLDVPLDQFVNELQKKIAGAENTGFVRIEDVNEETGKINPDRCGRCRLFRASCSRGNRM